MVEVRSSFFPSLLSARPLTPDLTFALSSTRLPSSQKHLTHMTTVQSLAYVPRTPGVPPLSDAHVDDALSQGVVALQNGAEDLSNPLGGMGMPDDQYMFVDPLSPPFLQPRLLVLTRSLFTSSFPLQGHAPQPPLLLQRRDRRNAIHPLRWILLVRVRNGDERTRSQTIHVRRRGGRYDC